MVGKMSGMSVTSGRAGALPRRDALTSIERIESAHGHPILSDHLRLLLGSPGSDADSMIIGRATLDATSEVVVCAAPGHGRYIMEVVTPHHHAGVTGHSHLVTSLVHSVIDRIWSTGSSGLTWWISAHETWAEAIARTLGMERERELLQMRVRLAGEVLDRIQHSATLTNSCDPRTDIDGVIEVNNRAFGDHPEQGGWTREDFDRRMNATWFSPDDLRVVHIDGTVAAFCWTKRHDQTEHDPALGEIYVIAVDPAHHGKGLGRGVVAAGLAHIRAEISPDAMLYVDAANTSAVSLYTSLGMDIHHRESAWGLRRAP